METYCSIKIRQMPSGDWVRLKCLTTTAQFYGWLEAFSSSFEIQRKRDREEGRLITDPANRVKYSGGRSFRVCRSNDTGGQPAGLTNRFRLTWGHSDADLALLARLIAVEWGWMESTGGRRIRRAEWLNRPVNTRVFDTHPLLLAHPAIAAHPRQAEGLAVPAVAGSFRAEPLAVAGL